MLLAWTLEASASSEDLGALLSTDTGAGPVGRVKDEDEDEGQATWVDDDDEGDKDGAREGGEEVTDEDAEVGDAKRPRRCRAHRPLSSVRTVCPHLACHLLSSRPSLQV